MIRGWDYQAVLAWRVGDMADLTGSAAWENALKAEESRVRFWTELAASVNKTVAASGEAVVKTLANVARR